MPTSSNLYGESSGHPTINLVQEFKQEKKKNIQSQKESAGNQKKTKIVEVIDFGGEDTNTAPINNQFFSEDDQDIHSESNDQKTRLRLQRNDSDMMLKKLMENIRGNTGLKNKYIRQMFKLDLIREESDLHQYKNLLNAMAALFYTNH